MYSTFPPESDGLTEQVRRTLEETLRIFLPPARDDWDDLLPTVEIACNSTVHDNTGPTPFVLQYGQKLPTTMDRAMGNYVPAASEFVGTMRKAFEDAKCNMVRAQQRHKSYADSRRRDVEF